MSHIHNLIFNFKSSSFFPIDLYKPDQTSLKLLLLFDSYWCLLLYILIRTQSDSIATGIPHNLYIIN